MADEQANVVIIDDEGTRHVFPPGFDPKRAAQIVKQGLAPTPPASTSNLDRLASMLPTAGGMIGGATGGVPGAAIGGAAGEGYRKAVTSLGQIPGAVRDVASKLLPIPGVPYEPGATARGAVEGMASGAKDAGIESALQAVYELGGKAVSAGLSAGGRAVYRGYLKPSLSARLLPKAAEIVETGIREGLPVTDAGSAKATQLIGELQAEVQQILKDTPGEVNLSDVANKVRAFAKRRYYIPGKPSADFDAAMKVADELDSHGSLPRVPGAPVTEQTTSSILDAQGQPMTSTRQVPGEPTVNPNVSLSKANDVKAGLDQSVGEANFGIDRGATKTAQKVARRGVRQAIEAQAPNVAPLNARESKLIDLANALQRATGREGNRNALYGVPTMAAAASGAAELSAGAGRYGAGAMALAVRMGLTPAVATKAAILAAKMGDQLPGTAVADVARIAVQTISQSQQ
jgi:hypothetical protein